MTVRGLIILGIWAGYTDIEKVTGGGAYILRSPYIALYKEDGKPVTDEHGFPVYIYNPKGFEEEVTTDVYGGD